jgi:DNA-3-methyladenine glycosylase
VAALWKPKVLCITHAHNSMSLASSPFEIRPGHGDVEVITGLRTDISKAVSLPWRFGLAGSAYVRRPFPL